MDTQGPDGRPGSEGEALLPRGSRATIDDVAELAGVSRQTVSNVVNGTGRLSSPTRERVLDAIASLGYRPHRGASGLRSRRTRQIAHPMPPVQLLAGNLVDIEFVQALVQAAGEHHYDVLLTASSGVEGIAELVRSGSVDGVVLSNLDMVDERAVLLARSGIPFGCFGRTDPSLPQTWVDIDNDAATRRVVRRLVDAGHTRIGFLGWGTDEYWNVEREAGFRAGMAEAGLKVPPGAVRRIELGAAAEAARALLEVPRPPTAVVTGGDPLAAAVYQAAARLGRRVGRNADLAVTGFDASSIGRSLVPSLTTVVIPTADIARLVLERVLAEVDRPTGEPGRFVDAPLLEGDSG